jgi:hypothetical protein
VADFSMTGGTKKMEKIVFVKKNCHSMFLWKNKNPKWFDRIIKLLSFLTYIGAK